MQKRCYHTQEPVSWITQVQGIIRVYICSILSYIIFHRTRWVNMFKPTPLKSPLPTFFYIPFLPLLHPTQIESWSRCMGFELEKNRESRTCVCIQTTGWNSFGHNIFPSHPFLSYSFVLINSPSIAPSWNFRLTQTHHHTSSFLKILSTCLKAYRCNWMCL